MSIETINWDSIPYPLALIRTPQDGHCLFHAICNSFYKPYRLEMIDGIKASRQEIVVKFRSELALLIDQVNPMDKLGRTFYDTYANGTLKEMGKTDPNYTLDGMKAWLNSNSPMGDEIITFVSTIIQKDIYFLDTRTRNIYVTSSVPSGENESIILFYNGEHYDLACAVEDDGSYTTLFNPNDELIQYLRNSLHAHKRK